MSSTDNEYNNKQYTDNIHYTGMISKITGGDMIYTRPLYNKYCTIANYIQKNTEYYLQESVVSNKLQEFMCLEFPKTSLLYTLQYILSYCEDVHLYNQETESIRADDDLYCLLESNPFENITIPKLEEYLLKHFTSLKKTISNVVDKITNSLELNIIEEPIYKNRDKVIYKNSANKLPPFPILKALKTEPPPIRETVNSSYLMKELELSLSLSKKFNMLAPLDYYPIPSDYREDINKEADTLIDNVIEDINVKNMSFLEEDYSDDDMPSFEDDSDDEDLPPLEYIPDEDTPVSFLPIPPLPPLPVSPRSAEYILSILSPPQAISSLSNNLTPEDLIPPCYNTIMDINDLPIVEDDEDWITI